MDKTSQQKWELMAALYQHGTNVEKLASVLQGSWTRTEIIAAMMRYSRRAQKQKESNESEQRDVPLQQWLSYIKNLHTIEGTTNKHKGRISKDSLPKDYSPLMSKVMLYAACFEEHYQGTSKDDPNYSAIYRYLSQLLAGEEPTQLAPASASKVLEMINRLKKIIKHKDSYEYFRSLHSQNPLNPKFETPTPDEATDSNKEIDGILYDEAENIGSEEEIDINDPSYNLKKERILKRFADSQRKVGRSLLDIPGVNPLRFMEHYLVKPKNPTIDLLNPAKKRKLSVDTDDNISTASVSVSATAEEAVVIAEPSTTTATGVPSASGVPLSMQLQHLVYAGPHTTSTMSNFYAPKTETSNNIR